jgi:release factor glutamine methyltransferase
MAEQPLRRTTVLAALKWAHAQLGLDRLDAHVLLGHVLGRDRSWLIAHGDDELPDSSRAHFCRLSQRRRAGEPVAYLIGHREFFGHLLSVGPSVLIPRPETELLVEQTLDELPRDAQVLELATGSGAVAISIALARPDVVVLATDLSATALAVARGNARRLGATVVFVAGDWYGALEADESGRPPGQTSARTSARTSAMQFDRIVVNPPYIAAQDDHLQQGDLRFEPPNALASGADGLEAIRVIIDGAPSRLVRGGCLLIEHGYSQGHAVRSLLEAQGLQHVRTWQDLAGHDRVSTGVR